MGGNSKPKVAIVTDSCASIPEPLIEALDIHWVPYYIHRGQEVLRDLVNVQRETFYAWLPTARRLPTTASPGPGDYITLYEKLARERGVREIASIHMTSKGSGAYQAAMVAKSMARETLPDLTIEVIDTLNVSMCQGWMVIEAARAALEGKSLASIVELVKHMIPVTRMIQTADTLKYLYMGGRIGRATHLVGSLLNIKPLISMEDGVIVALGQARGRPRAYQKMVELIEDAVGPGGKIKIAYVHAAAQAEAEKIRELVEGRLACVESLVAELSPVLGVHSGPGTAGVCYFPLA
jgi:DegV family protein with EDD domain